jgi:hypothetical protein
MLKKASSFVLASLKASTYGSQVRFGLRHGRLTNSAARTDVLLVIPRSVRLPAALLREGARLGAPGVGGCKDDLFEHPGGIMAPILGGVDDFLERA